MNYGKKAPIEVIKILEEKNVQFIDIDYYAWPQDFSSTTGPRGGWGGCAISRFTVEAWVCDGSGPTVYVCYGMYSFENLKFTPFKRVRNWHKLDKTNG